MRAIIFGAILFGIASAASLQQQGCTDPPTCQKWEIKEFFPLTVQKYIEIMYGQLCCMDHAETTILDFADKAIAMFSADSIDISGFPELADRWDEMGNVTGDRLETATWQLGWLGAGLYLHPQGFGESNNCGVLDDKSFNCDNLQSLEAQREEVMKIIAAFNPCFRDEVIKAAQPEHYQAHKDAGKLNEEEAVDIVFEIGLNLHVLRQTIVRGLVALKKVGQCMDQDNGSQESKDGQENNGNPQSQQEMDKRILTLLRRFLEEKRGKPHGGGSGQHGGGSGQHGGGSGQHGGGSGQHGGGSGQHGGGSGQHGGGSGQHGGGSGQHGGGSGQHGGGSGQHGGGSGQHGGGSGQHGGGSGQHGGGSGQHGGSSEVVESGDEMDKKLFPITRDAFFEVVDYMLSSIEEMKQNFEEEFKKEMTNQEQKQLIGEWVHLMFHSINVLDHNAGILVHIMVALTFNENTDEIAERVDCAFRSAPFNAELDFQNPQPFLDALKTAFEEAATCFKNLLDKDNNLKDELDQAAGSLSERVAFKSVSDSLKNVHLIRINGNRFYESMSEHLESLREYYEAWKASQTQPQVERELMDLLKRRLDDSYDRNAK